MMKVTEFADNCLLSLINHGDIVYDYDRRAEKSFYGHYLGSPVFEFDRMAIFRM